MRVRGIDPRDTAWEVDIPTFRVHFWEPQGAPGQRNVAFTSYEYEVTEADAHDVIRWAEQEAGPHRTYTLYVLASDGRQLGMVRLAGQDPTDPTEPHTEFMPRRPEGRPGTR